jgi:hypothetical protein
MLTTKYQFSIKNYYIYRTNKLQMKYKYKYKKEVLDQRILAIMEFEKMINNVLEPIGIEPIYFPFENLEGKFNNTY